MIDTNDISAYVKQVTLEEIVLFLFTIAILTAMTSYIKRFILETTKKYPTKRTALLNWLPFLNFFIYVTGILTSAYLIFKPTEKVYLGFITSILILLGYSSKDLALSFIAGIVLLLDKPFQVGDLINFQNIEGEVINIGFRSIKLLTVDENIVTIPNNKFINDIVSSNNSGNLSATISINTHITESCNLIKVKNILEQIAINSNYINIDKPISVTAKEFLNSNGTVSIIMTTKCIIKDARNSKKFQTDFIIKTNDQLKTYKN